MELLTVITLSSLISYNNYQKFDKLSTTNKKGVNRKKINKKKYIGGNGNLEVALQNSEYQIQQYTFEKKDEIKNYKINDIRPIKRIKKINPEILTVNSFNSQTFKQKYDHDILDLFNFWSFPFTVESNSVNYDKYKNKSNSNNKVSQNELNLTFVDTKDFINEGILNILINNLFYQSNLFPNFVKIIHKYFYKESQELLIIRLLVNTNNILEYSTTPGWNIPLRASAPPITPRTNNTTNSRKAIFNASILKNVYNLIFNIYNINNTDNMFDNLEKLSQIVEKLDTNNPRYILPFMTIEHIMCLIFEYDNNLKEINVYLLDTNQTEYYSVYEDMINIIISLCQYLSSVNNKCIKFIKNLQNPVSCQKFGSCLTYSIKHIILFILNPNLDIFTLHEYIHHQSSNVETTTNLSVNKTLLQQVSFLKFILSLFLKELEENPEEYQEKKYYYNTMHFILQCLKFIDYHIEVEE